VSEREELVCEGGSDRSGPEDCEVKLASEALEPGGFYYEGKLRPAPKHATDPVFTAAVWGSLEAAQPRALAQRATASAAPAA